MPPPVPSAVRVLLAGAIDYAGLFPPAELDMPEAVANYLEYRSSPEAWALGRFVVPVARLTELEDALRRSPVRRTGRVPMAVLVGDGTADDVDTVDLFNRRAPEHGARVGAVEVKAASDGVVRAVLAAIPLSWIRYVEIPAGERSEDALAAVARGGAFAKVRTGGTSPNAFPEPDRLPALLVALAPPDLPFKATGGLPHPPPGPHPLRGPCPLTAAPAAPAGAMYGYLNLMLAAALVHAGAGEARAREALLEEDPGALRLEEDALVWRDARFDAVALAALREGFFHGFGSCSFREPLDALPAAFG